MFGMSRYLEFCFFVHCARIVGAFSGSGFGVSGRDLSPYVEAFLG